MGLSQQHRFAPGALAVGLAVANDLDSSADFDALCYEDAATGNLLLRGHVTVRFGPIGLGSEGSCGRPWYRIGVLGSAGQHLACCRCELCP